ncbi:CRTAC1 family protein [Actomonas aquatica]|uniref:CRTAC1 family protein n=1 Tax=Actomonas aquatica TaxID=2866162 RepID=A0ABZ1C7R4_9BACT|nr:CRTAC1 family protein [Opitutus sp. WL0086]WRQ86574.1 CRTAC1 family protein [Opitutus sp. WL0086]
MTWLALIGGTGALSAAAWWLLRLQDTDQAEARIHVSTAYTDEARADHSPVRFIDVTAPAGLVFRHGPPTRHRALPEDNGSGLAWGDYDGDGDPDLYLVNHPGIVPTVGWDSSGNRLYRNNGDGTFTDLTDIAGVADPAGFGMGATWIDYDNDGHLDLHVTNRGPNRLYRNLGDGTFIDVAVAAGVDDPGWGTGTAWGDYDRDGHLDFYLCNYVDYDSDGREPPPPPPGAAYEAPYTINSNAYDASPNRLFRNRGDGTFEDVTAATGVANPDGRSLAAFFCDLDGDGWLDLYVNNDVSANRLYRNSGADFGPDEPVFFLDLSAVTGTADGRGSMGLSVAETGDIDGTPDGLPDLFIAHWLAQENALYQSHVTATGKLEYLDKARPFRLGEISIDRVGWGSAFADLDRDGRIDLVVANGSTLERDDDRTRLVAEPLLLFMQDDGGFRDVAALAGPATSRAYTARGLALADYDGDGDLDLAFSQNQGDAVLLRNDTPRDDRQALVVHLDAPDARRFGARVMIESAGRRQWRWWGADVSYLSQHGPELIFGLGLAKSVERLEVQWADGRITTLTDLNAGSIRVTYPQP